MSTSEPKTGSAVRSVVNVGDVLNGRYRVEEVIHESDTSVVVAATLVPLKVRVAIKIALPGTMDASIREMLLLDEARFTAMIESEHIARVIDVGELSSGPLYMVMELLSGSNLADVIRTTGPLSPDIALDYILQASEALAEAHARGIVHRNLALEHLFLTKREDGSPFIKVLDFSLSKITPVTRPGSETSAETGAPTSVLPTQTPSLPSVDGRSDIWSLGVILFVLLTGSHPFAADTVTSAALKVMTEPPKLLRSLRPEVSAEVDAIVARCLEKDPARRFQHLGEMAEAIAPLVTGRARRSAERVIEIASRPALDEPLPAEVTSKGARSGPPEVRKKSGSARAMSVALLVALCGGASLFALQGSAPSLRPSSAGAVGIGAPSSKPDSAPGGAREPQQRDGASMNQDDPIGFDTTGFAEYKSEVETTRRWRGSTGDEVSLDYIPAPTGRDVDLNNIDDARAFYRKMAADAKGAIIEVEPLTLAGVHAIRTIIKIPQQPHGMTYIGSITLPFRDFAYIVKVECQERGATGMRDSVVFAKTRRSTPPLTSQQDVFEGWMADPYDAAIKAPLMRNRSEAEEYDSMFPDHPLSRARSFLRGVQATLRITPALRSAPPYRSK